MKIRSKLILIGIIPVSLLLVLTTAFLWATNQVERATHKAIVADEMASTLADLSILTYEHHLYFEERSHIQWEEKHAFLGKQIAAEGVFFDSAEERELVDRLTRTARNLKFLFAQYGPHPRHGQGMHLSDQDKSFHDRITARILQDLSVITPVAHTLHDMNHDQSLALSQRIDMMSVVVVGVIAILLLILSFLVIRSFSVPVGILNAAFGRLSGGDLSCRIGSSAKDELGVLSRGFDNMAQRLQESSDSLHRLNQELEQRVDERTGELLYANAELRLNEERLAVLFALSQREFETEEELIRYALEEAVRLARSKGGYLHFFHEDQQTLGLFLWSETVMEFCTAEKLQHYPLGEAGIWADSVRQRQPVVYNDYQNMAGKKGVPEGHFPLLRHLSIPIFDEEEIVAVLGVGNKEDPYDADDVQQLLLYMHSVWEIVKRKRVEESLKQYAEALKRSNKELEHFAYVASHDLQEPLRKIGSFTELLARKYQGQLDEKADIYIGYIVDGAQRMQILINDLLAFSRVTTKGKEFEPVDCNALLARVQLDMELALKESGAHLNVGELPTVMADVVQLGQVFQNLIGNAIKYSVAGHPPDIAVAAVARDSEWLFSVRDTGIGIEPQHFERVFQLFQRLHTREEYSGTGIGLALCKKIVERHGGRIWLESEAGKGSTFFFTVPRGLEQAGG